MLLDLTDGKSISVQVIAWCCQAQAITWANIDLDFFRHKASLGHNELKSVSLTTTNIQYVPQNIDSLSYFSFFGQIVNFGRFIWFIYI